MHVEPNVRKRIFNFVFFARSVQRERSTFRLLYGLVYVNVLMLANAYRGARFVTVHTVKDNTVVTLQNAANKFVHILLVLCRRLATLTGLWTIALNMSVASAKPSVKPLAKPSTASVFSL